MKVAILIIIAALGLLLPLFWITGTATAIVHFYRHRGKATADVDTRQATVFNPHLGLTMADGGDAIDKEKNERRKQP